MDNHSWKEISIKEKMQIINGTVLVTAAIVLYFLAFAITLENQLFEMKTEVELKMRRLEELEKRHLDET